MILKLFIRKAAKSQRKIFFIIKFYTLRELRGLRGERTCPYNHEGHEEHKE